MRVGSKLSSWWHKFVDGLDVSDETRALLHAYGLYAIWAVMVGVPLLMVLSCGGCPR